MRRSLLVTILLLTLPVCGALAEEVPVAAVPNIKGTDVAKAVVSTCRSLIETALIKTAEFSVLSYTNVEEILLAQEFSLSDCTDEACAVEIGKLLAAELIVVGELSSVGEKMMLSIRLVNVSTGRSLRAETVEIGSLEELRERAFEATYHLAGLKYIAEADTGVKEVGHIYVTSPPGRTLEVYIDGELKGTTPLLIEQIPFGTHLLEAKQGEYVFRQEISIRTKEIEELFADVQTLTGNLILEVEPTDATGFTIFVDGEKKSIGLIKGVPAGERTITIEGSGWHYEGQVRIEPDRNVRERVRLSEFGQIRVSFPEGARAGVESSGFSTELRSDSQETIEVGTYTLTVEQKDHHRHQQEVEIRRGAVVSVSVALKPTEAHTMGLALEELRARREAMVRRRSTQSVGGWVLGALGVAGLTATGVLGYLADGQLEKLEAAYATYEGSRISTDLEDLWGAVEAERSTFDKIRTGLLGSLAAAGVSVTLSVVLFAVRPSVKKIDEDIRRIEAQLE